MSGAVEDGHRGLQLLHARSLRLERVGAGFLAPGSSLVLQPSPAFGRVAALKRLEENGLSGYSGGTAQVFDLLPFSPSYRGAPRRNDETVTQEEGGCQCALVRTLEWASQLIAVLGGSDESCPSLGNERAKSRAVVERYLRRIWKRLWHAYQADRRNFPTPIVLRACLSDEGVVEVVTTHVSGGSASLDAAAEDLLRRASPFGRAPAEVAGASLELTLRARSPVLP